MPVGFLEKVRPCVTAENGRACKVAAPSLPTRCEHRGRRRLASSCLAVCRFSCGFGDEFDGVPNILATHVHEFAHTRSTHSSASADSTRQRRRRLTHISERISSRPSINSWRTPRSLLVRLAAARIDSSVLLPGGGLIHQRQLVAQSFRISKAASGATWHMARAQAASQAVASTQPSLTTLQDAAVPFASADDALDVGSDFAMAFLSTSS